MNPIKRNYIPGSEWLYVKIYSGFSFCEKLLNSDIYHLTRQLLKENLIEKWFFVRFNDSDFHLRIRFQLKNIEEFGRVISIINKKFEKYIGNIVDKIQLDTYKRELERYRPYLIETIESIFFIESTSMLKVLRRLDNNRDKENYRWLLGLKIINDYLGIFMFDDYAKLEFLKEISSDYKMEFGNDKNNLLEMRNKYRQNKVLIEDMLSGAYFDREFKRIVICAEFSVETTGNLHKIKDKLSVQKENLYLKSIIRSIIHMMMNRLFVFKNRMYELVLYDFLYMYYIAKIGKLKKRVY